MLIKRELFRHLIKWKDSPSRLPLILRGARQVGKTTLINQFGKSYDQYLYFNLEKKTDANLLEHLTNISRLVQLLFLSRGFQNNPDLSSLIFFDEVQEKPEVLESLRYFKEEYPNIDIIASGSLLEFGLSKTSRIPVGRVEYVELHPFSFKEYLRGTGNENGIEILNSVPIGNEFLSIFISFSMNLSSLEACQVLHPHI